MSSCRRNGIAGFMALSYQVTPRGTRGKPFSTGCVSGTAAWRQCVSPASCRSDIKRSVDRGIIVAKDRFRSFATEAAQMATVPSEYLEGFAAENEPDGLYEVVDGRIVEKPMGAYECWLAAVLFGSLDPFNQANPIGRVVQEMIFDLRPQVDRERRPDVAFVSFERWGQDRGIPGRGHGRSSRTWPSKSSVSRTRPMESPKSWRSISRSECGRCGSFILAKCKVYVYRSTTAIQVSRRETSSTAATSCRASASR